MEAPGRSVAHRCGAFRSCNYPVFLERANHDAVKQPIRVSVDELHPCQAIQMAIDSICRACSVKVLGNTDAKVPILGFDHRRGQRHIFGSWLSRDRLHQPPPHDRTGRAYSSFRGISSHPSDGHVVIIQMAISGLTDYCGITGGWYSSVILQASSRTTALETPKRAPDDGIPCWPKSFIVSPHCRRRLQSQDNSKSHI